jgi:hypothetical protein
LATFFPLATFFVAQQVTLSILRDKDRPRSYLVRVDGTTEAEFAGILRVDGEIHKVKGQLPAEFVHNALQVELAFALVNPRKGDRIKVHVFIDGTNPYSWSDSHSGIHEQFDSFGYAEWAGGTSYRRGGNLSPEDVSKLVKDHAMPPKGIMWP